jgi:predicted RNA-binding protein YlqC (UPF0109 family)
LEEEEQQAFEELKTKLTTSPILAYADLNRQPTITCDASNTAIGYILSPKDNQNRTRVIAYGGRSLSAIKVITKLPNSEQSYKGKVKTHNYINRQNQSTTGKL